MPALVKILQLGLLRPWVFALAWIQTGAVVTGDTGTSAAGAQFYTEKVKPLLQARCYACHGALKQKSGLRLDTAAAILKGGDDGPAVRPGNPGGSLLVQRVGAATVEERMPPEHEGEPFSPAEVTILTDWISRGAPAPSGEKAESDPSEHWAFRPASRPVIPPFVASGSIRNPIDAFLQVHHLREGLTPQKEAARETLIRRLFIDLIGIPPSESEWISALRDESSNWYELLVDRLLADPRHGERWGRHWMDVWRYSDWWGLGDQLRNSQPHIWHWRDWIIESLNRDLPYDEMVRLMLAADEQHPDDPSKLRATGFLARNYFLFNRNQWMEETVEHVSKGLLGLTMNCTKCHDHKYDPIPQVDFYRMRAFFEPYHVRIDMVPGETDLTKNGIPRVYDGLLETPTYRFVRGEEGRPDKSASIAPGVPEFLSLKLPAVAPVELPLAAWQPERREWVLASHENLARRNLESAVQALSDARRNDGKVVPASEQELSLRVAEAAVSVAQDELQSIQKRGGAMRLSWAAGSRDAGSEKSQGRAVEARLQAILAERQVEVSRAGRKVAELELRLFKTESSKKEAVAKELTAAREQFDKSRTKLSADVGTNETFAPLTGAKWTPTRFLSSTADDPVVKFSSHSTGRRSALARWITDPRNPLPARVAVNHIWSRHLGVPLVPTVFDFGRKGVAPAQPELVDWLASEFVNSGWSMKHLHRLIVNSAAYRRSSSMIGMEANQAKDPDNRHWWRRVPVRVEAQVVRDALLFHAGRLDPVLGGPPVPAGAQASSRRRSLYFFHSNNDRNLFLSTFDDARVKECYRRDQSIVPQQALAMINSSLTRESADAIAEKLGGSAGSDELFVRRAFLLLLGFEPNQSELGASLKALEGLITVSKKSESAGAETTARSRLIWSLLNHNDFVTLR